MSMKPVTLCPSAGLSMGFAVSEDRSKLSKLESKGSTMEGDPPNSNNGVGGEGIGREDGQNPQSSSFQNEEGSLMHLYESRLRRLRDYEARVYSRYPNPGEEKTNEAWQASDLDGPQTRFDGYYQQQPRAPSNRQDPPSVIDVQVGVDSMDDITVSTGLNSDILSPGVDVESVRLDAAIDETKRSEVETSTQKIEPNASQDEEEDAVEPIHRVESGSIGSGRSSMNADIEEVSLGRGDESGGTDGTQQDEDITGDVVGNFTYAASSDSKFELYPVLVDPNQDDRAVEIALYSAKRPHMRAFHYAWLGFFVAFFNWFGIAPLMSEVAHSLRINRTEVWTANTMAVVGSFITRLMAGPLNDKYGPRLIMSISLLISAIPSIISGVIIVDATSLYIVRFLIGIAGCTFVTCQFWTSSMFTTEVAGTALSLTAGWGNLGGGVSQVFMGSILFPLFKIIYGGEGYSSSKSVYPDEESDYEIDKPSDRAWRTVLAIPGLLCLYVAYVSFRHADDTPKGNFRKRKLTGLMDENYSALRAFKHAANNRNTWLMFIQYGCCFGVELTMTSAAALYFQEEFGQSTASAAAIASVFGWMNLFARGLGGFCSDMASATYGMRGRLWIQVCCLICQGSLVCVFSTTTTLAGAIVVMVVFSIFVQASEGSSFAIVPYIDLEVTGSISGIVGAGGNFGAIIFSLIFRENQNRKAFFYMGCSVIASSILSALVIIKGHRGLLSGIDAREVTERRKNHEGQLGNVPNVEFQQSSEAHKNRQTVLRVEQNPPESSPESVIKSSDKNSSEEAVFEEVVDENTELAVG